MVDPEPSPGPELDPEQPLSVDPWPEPPSLPELVEVLLPMPPSLLRSLSAVTAVAPSEPSRPLPDEPPPEDVSS